MHKSDKERVVAELTERLRTTDTLIVADYRGLTMPQIDALRSRLLEHGARFTVVKNTLTRRAAEAAGSDTLLTLLEGPTAIAFLEAEGDPVAVAKALGEAARETRVLEVRGGVLQGRQIGADEVESLAKLPAAEVLRAQLVGAVAGPLTTVVGLFNAPLRDLVGVIDARIRQLEESGEDPSAGRAEPADEPQAAEPAAEEPRSAAGNSEPESAAPAEPEAASGSEPQAEAPAAEEEGGSEAEAEASEPEPETASGSEPQADADAEGPHADAEEPAPEEQPEQQEPADDGESAAKVIGIAAAAGAAAGAAAVAAVDALTSDEEDDSAATAESESDKKTEES